MQIFGTFSAHFCGNV